jgi:5-methylcytosine-specific restriction endonuclease McrA
MLQVGIMIESPSLHQLTDPDLIARLRVAVGRERQATAELIALLMELDARRLYLAEGCSSLFTYCTQVLHLTEHAAYGRIEAARAARKFPVILTRLHDGTLSLTAVGLLAAHLTDVNHVQVLDAARHKSKREVEQLVAALSPKPDVAPALRKLPAPKPAAAPVTSPAAAALPIAIAGDDPAPAALVSPRHAEVKPLAPERFKLQLTISRATHDKLRRIQDLLRHSVPDGDLETIVDKALTLLLEHTERTKLAVTPRPLSRPASVTGTRHIPAAVKRAVWKRDDGRCAFEGREGRCQETGFLEFHHVVPYAAGGETSVENLHLRCRAHNALEAERWFGQLPLVRERGEEWGDSCATRSGPSW